MKKIVFAFLANIILYILIQVLSTFIAFYFFGIGASASSERYISWVKYQGVALQVLIIFYFKYYQKYLTSNSEFLFLLLQLFILAVLWELQ